MINQHMLEIIWAKRYSLSTACAVILACQCVLMSERGQRGDRQEDGLPHMTHRNTERKKNYFWSYSVNLGLCYSQRKIQTYKHW